ncbi:uncharacterized [Tachysurus ichikawai]
MPLILRQRDDKNGIFHDLFRKSASKKICIVLGTSRSAAKEKRSQGVWREGEMLFKQTKATSSEHCGSQEQGLKL